MAPKNPIYPGQRSLIPSQRIGREAPYSPRIQPDQVQLEKLRHPSALGYPHREAYVLPNWESRPINATDVVFSPIPVSENGPENQLNLFFNYIVPEGRTLFLRTVSFIAYPQTNNTVAGGDTTNPPTAINKWGAPTFPVDFVFDISLLLNGSAWEDQSDITLQDWVLSYSDLEVYMIAGQGDTVTFRIRTTFPGGGDLGAEFAASVLFHGNLLLSSGTDRQLQAGNEMPLPVRPASPEEINRLRTQGSK